jgi:hypothetical protein
MYVGVSICIHIYIHIHAGGMTAMYVRRCLNIHTYTYIHIHTGVLNTMACCALANAYVKSQSMHEATTNVSVRSAGSSGSHQAKSPSASVSARQFTDALTPSDFYVVNAGLSKEKQNAVLCDAVRHGGWVLITAQTWTERLKWVRKARSLLDSGANSAAKDS